MHMIVAVLIFLILLWVLGYVDVPFIPDFQLFELLGRSITLYDVLTFALMVWVIELLPNPFRMLAGIVLALWLLSFFGIIAIAGLSQIIVLALIAGLIAYLLGFRR